jgi:hypothetical protein
MCKGCLACAAQAELAVEVAVGELVGPAAQVELVALQVENSVHGKHVAEAELLAQGKDPGAVLNHEQAVLNRVQQEMEWLAAVAVAIHNL